MLSVVYAPSFVRRYVKLPKNLQTEIREKIEFFRNPKNHTLLKVHKLKGIADVFSFSINYKIRIVFEYDKKETVHLLLVGCHDDVY